MGKKNCAKENKKQNKKQKRQKYPTNQQQQTKSPVKNWT